MFWVTVVVVVLILWRDCAIPTGASEQPWGGGSPKNSGLECRGSAGWLVVGLMVVHQGAAAEEAGFVRFVADVEAKLRQALVATFGPAMGVRRRLTR